MKITAIPQLYRNIKRWREILAVLRRYGLADGLTHFRLPFRDVFKDQAGIPLSQFTREQRIRMALVELGPTFIKLGQILSGRPDLIGPVLQSELKTLRADVRPESIDNVRSTLAEELGEGYEESFQFIDPEPMATASIGQVHQAVLNDGTKVVIKVQRRGIENTVQQDIEVLGGVAQLAERVETLAAWGPSEMVRQMAPMITKELDFARERQNLELFAETIGKTHSDVVVPKPYPGYCTRRVLVMDQLDGVPLADFLADDGIDTERASETRMHLSETIASVYLSMIFDDGLFHADPHAGNLIVLNDGHLGILDFGMIGRIDEKLRESIEEMLVAISSGDQSQLTRLIRRIGDAPPAIDDSVLSIDAAEFISTYGRQDLSSFDMSGAINDLSEMLHRHKIKLPNQSALLLKMLISLEGTLRELGASFDSLDVVRSFTKKMVIRRFSPLRRAKQARRIYLEAEHFMEEVPDELISLLKQARKGEVKMSLDHQRLGPSVNRLVLGLMASAVFLGSSLMLAMKVPPLLFTQPTVLGMQDLSLLGLGGVLSSITVMMWLLIAINRSGHLTRGNDD